MRRNGYLVDEIQAIGVTLGEEEGGYIADIPDLEFCPAFGDTTAEALKEVEKAKKAWLATAKTGRKSISKPCYRPAIYQLAPAP